MSTNPPLASARAPPLLPTVDRIARFRILVLGRSGTGKTTLINAIFKTSLVDIQDTSFGVKADINRGITSEHNQSLILHDSQGYERFSDKRFDDLKKFVYERCYEEDVSERIHAIWLCVTVPSTGSPLFQPSDERILQLDRNKVPLIVVFTKIDLFGQIVIDKISRGSAANDKHGQMKCKAGQILYALVSIADPATLQGLVKFTVENIHVDIGKQVSRRLYRRFSARDHQRTKPDEDLSDAAQITLAIAAQQGDIEAKVAASIKVGQMKYWRAIASSVFVGLSFQNCLDVIHKDIVAVWNIRGLNQYLLSNTFRSMMMLIVDDLDVKSRRTKVSRETRLSNWASRLYKGLPENTRCLMGYVVDLSLILQAVFQLSLGDLEGKARVDRVKEIIYEFYCSDKKKNIHSMITAFVKNPLAKESAVDKMRSQIYENRMTDTDTQFSYDRPTLPALLTILRMESAVSGGSKINGVSLNLLYRLLDFPNYIAIASALADTTDVQLLLDFILKVLRNGFLLNSGVQYANRKSRKFMLKLVKCTNTMPKSLFITNIELPDDVGLSQFGQVIKGTYQGSQVALKLLYKLRRKDDPIRNDYCRDVLVWLSLSHRYILPLLGLYEVRSQLILVSPFMKNGTLTKWRKTQKPSVGEIQKRMLEVAEGLCYLHSEGIVHGDLCGENVLLDSNFHCQITDFGLSRHTGITNTLATTELVINFAAPELFGACSRCSQEECEGCCENEDEWKPRKTPQTDVYAFGCLYYAVFYDTIPFHNKTQHQVVRLVTNGMNPDKLEIPRMSDNAWDLIKCCWAFKLSERPTMGQVVRIMATSIVENVQDIEPSCLLT